MTNKEWIMSLKPAQLRRRYLSGKVPTFAVYKVYNTVARKWQFSKEIVSDDPSKVWNMLFRKIGNNARKWRYDIDVYLYLNPLTLEWEEKRYCPRRAIKAPSQKDLQVMEKLKKKCEEWLQKEAVQ